MFKKWKDTHWFIIYLVIVVAALILFFTFIPYSPNSIIASEEYETYNSPEFQIKVSFDGEDVSIPQNIGFLVHLLDGKNLLYPKICADNNNQGTKMYRVDIEEKTFYFVKSEFDVLTDISKSEALIYYAFNNKVISIEEAFDNVIVTLTIGEKSEELDFSKKIKDE